MNDDKTSSGKLTRWAGAMLLAAVLFALAALVALGAFGRGNAWGWSFTVLGGLCLLGWWMGRRGSTLPSGAARDAYGRQRLLLGANAALSVLLLLALLVGANYVATRRHKVFDLTQNRINSLSDQTVKVLRELKSPVKMIFVWAAGPDMPAPDPAAQSVLEAYRAASDKVQVEFLNAVQDPLRVQQMRLNTFSGQPVLIVESQGKNGDSASTPSSQRQEVAVVDEQYITSALLKLASPTPRVLYCLAGHGEASLASNRAHVVAASTGYNGARAALEAQNYTLKTLTLAGVKATIPRDAAALMVLSPQVDLATGELRKLQQYVRGKGRLLLFLDPPRAAQRWDNWKKLAVSLGVQLLDGLIFEFDPSQMYQSPQYVMGTLDATRHPLLRGVSGAVVFPGVIPLRPLPSPPSAPPGSTPQVSPLFESSIQSQNVLLRGGKLAQGASGPFSLAAASERVAAGENSGGWRGVVCGNASFASDTAFNQFGNSSFFLGAVNWVVGNDVLVSIPPKAPITSSLSMPAAMIRFSGLFSLLALPLFILIVGTAVWWKRR